MITLKNWYRYNETTEAWKILTEALKQKEKDDTNWYISWNSFNSETNKILWL